MAAIPEFLLRKLYVPNSLRNTATGFSFDIKNNFAPASLTGIGMAVDGLPVPVEALAIQVEGDIPRTALRLDPMSPYPLPVDTVVHVRVQGMEPPKETISLSVLTREIGEVAFTIKVKAPVQDRTVTRPLTGSLDLGRLFQRQQTFAATVSVSSGDVIGKIAPFVYGQMVEHLENCVYGGIWTEDGLKLREDVLKLIKTLQPPVIRYPGGNFASAYHWEEGIGRRDSRPPRFDKAWNTWDSNLVGTDEFLQFCAQVGAQPYLVANDGSGTPEEAARWVAYCNAEADTSLGRHRAANGHVSPYGVQLWGVGNEVWGEWQIGHTDARSYVERLHLFVENMRFTDPTIAIVAVGAAIMSDDPDDPGRLWNEVVLREAGDIIDGLSFHIYQPGMEGWQEKYDPNLIHHAICAAPLDLEAMIQRMEAQIHQLVPGREVCVVLDEWNLQLPPGEKARSMHDLAYTVRDALYAAGVLNAFHRNCNSLAVANLAQLVNVLPLICANETSAFATPMYYPFLLYRSMEKLALRANVSAPTFDSAPLGNIRAHAGVPYIDATATRSEDGSRAALAVSNLHPAGKAKVTLSLSGFNALKPVKAWLLSGPEPLATNSFEAPDKVKAVEMPLPVLRGEQMEIELPPCSLVVVTLA